MAALNARDWARACELRIEPKRDCAAQLRRDFGGGKATLLDPGEYRNGDKITDNVTRYAIEVDGTARVRLAYFEVRKWGYDFSVDLQLTVRR